MEFIYAAVNSENATLKGKVSKWRHLQTILMQLLLLGLLFFLVMQNGQLKREISSKLSHQFVQDIFNEKISQISKQLEDIKLAILEAARENTLHHQEAKKIIRLLIKELGLPLQKQRLQKEEPFKAKDPYFQLIQLIQNQMQIQRRNDPHHLQQLEQKVQTQVIERQTLADEEQVQATYYFEGHEEQLSMCTYYQYLTQKYHQQPNTQSVHRKFQRKNRSAKVLGRLKFKDLIKDQDGKKPNKLLVLSPILSIFIVFSVIGVILVLLFSVCMGTRCKKWNRVRSLASELWRVRTSKRQVYLQPKK